MVHRLMVPGAWLLACKFCLPAAMFCAHSRSHSAAAEPKTSPALPAPASSFTQHAVNQHFLAAACREAKQREIERGVSCHMGAFSGGQSPKLLLSLRGINMAVFRESCVRQAHLHGKMKKNDRSMQLAAPMLPAPDYAIRSLMQVCLTCNARASRLPAAPSLCVCGCTSPIPRAATMLPAPDSSSLWRSARASRVQPDPAWSIVTTSRSAAIARGL